VSLTPDEQFELLTRDAAEVIPKDELDAKLRLGRPLRVKLGMDPTTSDVHLGSAVPLRKLRQFQDLGHTAVLILGDFTARIGDPSGADKTRPMLPKETVDAYAAKNLEQYGLILAPERLEVRRNSEWLETLDMQHLLELASHYTVARTLERDDFAERYAKGEAITIREFLYPLLQGYDSIAVNSDIEIGGTDQHFNFMVARHLQRAVGQEPQVVLTVPILEGTDGVKKMSQSLGNYIGITEPPEDMFGKLMRVSDELMDKYFRLCTDLSDEEIEATRRERPEARKRRLAFEVVKLYPGEEAARAAADHFDRVFVSREIPEDIPEVSIPADAINDSTVYVPRLLKAIGLAKSASEGRRQIEQGGVYVDGERIETDEVPVDRLRGKVLKVGKRHFRRLR
jgi:tyrosyl-tRNA synthetase